MFLSFTVLTVLPTHICSCSLWCVHLQSETGHRQQHHLSKEECRASR